MLTSIKLHNVIKEGKILQTADNYYIDTFCLWANAYTSILFQYLMKVLV